MTTTLHTLPRLDDIPKSECVSGFGAMETVHGNLPLEKLGYHSRVDGIGCSTTLTQAFYNPYDECIEATYVFPLPGTHAVVDCRMKVGDRVIRADLQERSAARAKYQRAIADGHRAAIAEEERSETFTLRVGNIPPGESIDVSLTFVGDLEVVADEATLRLPLVVAPRYVPGVPLDGESVGQGTHVDTNVVPDASRVTPPTLLPGVSNPVDLSINVQLEPGDIAATDWRDQLRSSLHTVSVDPSGPCVVRLQAGERVNRDFILRFPLAREAVSATLNYCGGDASTPGTFAVTLVAPSIKNTAPRDVVLLLDRSGSMGGWKMKAARRAVARLIDTLGDDDRFFVLGFDNTIETAPGLPAELVAATDQNRWAATSWLSRVKARGGTEAGQALRQGLRKFSNDHNHGSQRAAALVLITDGQVAGEDAVLRMVEKCEPNRRPQIFCLGIDRAVNASVLKRLSDATGGTTELVESDRRLDEVMKRFSEEIGSPAITGLTIEAPDGVLVQDSIAPSRRINLYRGRPRTIYGRVSHAETSVAINVHGRLGDGSHWQQSLIAEERPASSLLPMWGRHRVRELEDRYAMAGNNNQKLREDIIACSLESHVLCRFTAYVAVDESEVVNEGGQVHEVMQPVEQPEAWKTKQSRGPASRQRMLRKGRSTMAGFAGSIFDADEDVLEQIPASVARENSVVPVRTDGDALVVKMSDPSDQETIEKLRFILNRPIEVEAASRADIERSIDENYEQVDGESASSMLQEFTDTAIDFCETEADAASCSFDAAASDRDVPIIRFVALIITEAVQLKASHIYITPKEDRVVVVYIVAGKTVERENAPLRLHDAIMNRLKTLAKLSIERKNDLALGECKLTIGDVATALRVYMIPSEQGQSAMIRIPMVDSQIDPSNPNAIVSAWLSDADQARESKTRRRGWKAVHKKLLKDS